MGHNLSLGLRSWQTQGKGAVARGDAGPESGSVDWRRECRECGMSSSQRAGKRSSSRAFDHSRVFIYLFLILCAARSWSSECNEVIESNE